MILFDFRARLLISHLLTNSSSIVVSNTEAILKANCKVGSYLSFSIAFIVCLDTLQSLASSS